MAVEMSPKPLKHKTAVIISGTADGQATPHDGRYLMRWNPHTEFGTCEIDTTTDPSRARRFADIVAVLEEWHTVSAVQPLRPDGEPNKPLRGLTLLLTTIKDKDDD